MTEGLRLPYCHTANIAVKYVVASIRGLGLEVTPQKTELRNMFLHNMVQGASPPAQIGVGLSPSKDAHVSELHIG